jgi:hypothetical protein
VLTGQSGAGKSTLTAALVAAGAGYVTDEAVAVDLATSVLRGLAKPVGLKAGSWPVLPDLAPDPASLAPHPWRSRPWLVETDRIRPGAGTPGGPLAAVVLPRFTAGAVTSLEPVTAGHAVWALARNAFNPVAHGAAGLAALAAAVRGAACHRLVFGDLDEAVDAVLSVPATHRHEGCHA